MNQLDDPDRRRCPHGVGPGWFCIICHMPIVGLLFLIACFGCGAALPDPTEADTVRDVCELAERSCRHQTKLCAAAEALLGDEASATPADDGFNGSRMVLPNSNTIHVGGCPDCRDSTAGRCWRHPLVVTDQKAEAPALPSGWVCPKCTRVHSPLVNQCAPCNLQILEFD